MQQSQTDPFQALVGELCEALGLPVPTDLDGAFHFKADDLEIDVLRDPGGESLIVQCRVASLGDDPSLELLSEICEANFRWCATAGATLGLNRSTGEVLLAREHTLQALDGQRFLPPLERFIDAAGFWKQRLSGAPIVDAAPAAGESVPGYFVRI